MKIPQLMGDGFDALEAEAKHWREKARDADELRRRYLETRKYLHRLVLVAEHALKAIDIEMHTESTADRGSRMAKICNALEFAKDEGKHFGLGLPLRVPTPEKLPPRRKGTAVMTQEDETGWMLEHQVNGAAWWWTGLDLSPFSSDPNEGVRFCRQEDAERVRVYLMRTAGAGFDELIVTDHRWCYHPKSEPTTDGRP